MILFLESQFALVGHHDLGKFGGKVVCLRDHFKKYAAATKDMVALRELRIFSSVAMNLKGK